LKGVELWAIVHNAGIWGNEFLSDNSDELWQPIIETNLAAPYYLTKWLIPQVTRPGRILVISSQLGFEGRGGWQLMWPQNTA
jgi:NAD(P)-dependent dehydrogenase (short-subunit alcohol dehydrogenase family)